MTRRTIFGLIGLILIAAAAALLVLPARWLMAVVPASWPLSIAYASGSVWSGSATIAIGPPAQRRIVPEPLHWQWSFAHGPRMELEHPWLAGPLTLAFSLSGVGISAQTLRLPAQALATLDARIAAIGPTGDLSLAWPALHFGHQPGPPGTNLLKAEWRNAGSALSPVHPLGHYTLSLKQGANASTELALHTHAGPLMLEGTGILNAQQSLRFRGTAQADPAAGSDIHAALQDLLNALGPRQHKLTLLHY